MRIIRYIFPAVAVAAAAVLFGCEQAGAGSSIDDGTDNGGAAVNTAAALVKDINPGEKSSDPAWLETYDGTLYFSATAEEGRNLWQSDGSTEGTSVASYFRSKSASPQAGELETYYDMLYAAADYGSSGREFWSYTAQNGASLVEDINSTVPPGGGATYSSSPKWFTVATFYSTDFNTELVQIVFAADGGSDGRELWGYDEGNIPYQIADINENGDADPRYLTAGNNRIYFSAYSPFYDRELWSARYNDSTGSVEAKRLTEINENGSSDPAYLAMYDGTVFFAAQGHNRDVELYYYNSNDKEAKKINVNASGSSKPRNLFVYDGKLYFSAQGGEGRGHELWVYDAATGSASILKDINSGSGDSDPASFTEYKGDLYFRADDGEHGDEIWRTDGSASGTELVLDHKDGGAGSSPSYLTVYDGSLYFSADGGDTGFELWSLTAE
jgi:ELWxxDGT repeat protein